MASINWESAIKAAVNEGIKQVAEKKTNDLAAKDIPAATKTVTEAVVEQVKPIIENQTNQEPLWKSRVIRGSIVGLMGLAAAILKDYNDDGVILFNDIYAYAATGYGLCYAIYGRITSAGTPTV